VPEPAEQRSLFAGNSYSVPVRSRLSISALTEILYRPTSGLLLELLNSPIGTTADQGRPQLAWAVREDNSLTVEIHPVGHQQHRPAGLPIEH
jgi:hypothetical protein